MFCILSNIQDYSQFVVFVVVADVCDHDLESVTTKFLVFSSVTMSNFVHDVFSLPACWNLLAANVAWWPVQHVHLVNNCALLVLVKACCKYIGGFGIFLKSGYMARMTTHMGSWSCHHLCSICREFSFAFPDVGDHDTNFCQDICAKITIVLPLHGERRLMYLSVDAIYAVTV